MLSGVFNFDETESLGSSESLVGISRPSDTSDDFSGFDLDGQVGEDLGEGFVINSEGEVANENSGLSVRLVLGEDTGDIPCSAHQ